MTWFTWRQYRVIVLISVIVLGLLSFFLIRDEVVLNSLSQYMQWTPCNSFTDCLAQALASPDNAQYIAPMPLTYLQPWLPLGIGIFLGVPLVARELEQRTHYFTWTQRITRSRWLLAKLGVLTGLVLPVIIALALLVSWWTAPSMIRNNVWTFYNIHGLLLPAYTLFGLMLGITIGLILRRTVPAMALTSLLFLAAFTTLEYIHPWFISPQSRVLAIDNQQTDQWGGVPYEDVLYTGYADAQGRETGEISQYCNFNRTLNDPDYAALANKCIREHNLQWKVVYHTPDAFWPLQLMHAGLLLLLTLLLTGFSFWWLQKRIN